MSCQSRRESPAAPASTRWGLVALPLGLLALLLVCLLPAPAQAAPLYGETYLISTSHEDGPFGPESEFAAISKDGLRAFWTTTESLLAADSDNDNVDIYMRIDTHTTRLVTPGGDFDATFLGSSEDGSKVFFSTEEQIVGDADANVDIYRRNLDDVPPTTTNMTPGTDELVWFRGINLAGDRLFFETRESLTANDTDDEIDVYMSQDGSLTRISTGSRGGNDECGAYYSGSTPDGHHVFFKSEEQLTEDDDGIDDEFTCRTGFSDRGTPDIFHWSNGSVTNRTPTGACPNSVGAGCQADKFAASSLDGSRVIFNSPNIFKLPWDRDGGCLDDVYQTLSGAVTKLSPSQWDGTSSYCNPPPNGGWVSAAFVGASEDATKVYWVTREPGMAGAADGHKDIFLNTNGGAPELASPNTPNDDADFAWTTPDGSHLFFGTSDPVTDDSDTRGDVFQNVGGAITKISTGPLGGNGPFDSYFAGATDDAEYVFFRTGEPLTSDDQDTSGVDLFVRHDGATELISTGPRAGTGNYGGLFDGVSENGERVFFTSSEKLVSADTDQEEDVYMRWRGGPPSVRIDELALTPDPFVELLKSGEGQEEFPTDQGPYKIVVYDGDGDEVGEHTIAPELLRAQARPLFSDTHPDRDEPLGVTLPAVGQMCFTQGSGELMVDCVAWGCVATPVRQDITTVAPPDPGLSQQRQGDAPEVFHLASPTPKAVSVAGTTPPACPSSSAPDPNPGPGSGDGGGGGGDNGGGTGGDTSGPAGRASGKGKNKAGGPTKIAVSSDEDGTVAAAGVQRQTGNGGRGSKKKLTVKLKPVRKRVSAGRTVVLKLKPHGKKGRKAARKLRRAMRKRGAKAKATITVTFADLTGNKTKKKLTLRLR